MHTVQKVPIEVAALTWKGGNPIYAKIGTKNMPPPMPIKLEMAPITNPMQQNTVGEKYFWFCGLKNK